MLSRREFVAATTSGALALRTGRIMAGPFSADDDFPIPADKKLNPAWVRSLFARGAPEIVSGGDLRFIGMPVGGLFAGTVYLGGDGRLWNWDIFNEHHEGCVAREPVEYRGAPLGERSGANYVDPPEQRAPFDLGFSVTINGQKRTMDGCGWPGVRFRGEYPIGTVEYGDPGCPVSVRLEAFSPFIALEVERSSYPATVMRFTLNNTGAESVHAEICAEFENPVLINSAGYHGAATVRSRARRGEGLAAVVCSADVERTGAHEDRPDIRLADFESGTYEGWRAEGTAFGNGPRHISDIAGYQGDVNAEGEFLVNSHNTRQGEDVRAGDAHVGTLTSSPFTIGRRYINFRIGGGSHAGRTCMDLLIDGRVVRSATGRNDNRMRPAFFDVREFAGKQATVRIVDAEAGAWGNIGVDDIVMSDEPRYEQDLQDLADFGTFCVALLGGADEVHAGADPKERSRLGRTIHLEAGASTTVTFIVAWHFANLQIPGLPGMKRWYAGRWDDAYAVADAVARGLVELSELTHRWSRTWYDSTLPHWLLDRSFIPVSTLATNTCHRFDDGRFWFWEGVGCCHGTCTHVWGYAQATGRLFPEAERYLREQIDFGRFFHEDTGAIDYRAEFGRHVAHDGQCGCILRAYREHLMSPDDEFLRRVWSNVKRAVEYMIAEDADENGLLEGSQYNTLDASWYGPMGWLSSLYLAAVAAGGAMAGVVGDAAFAERCARIIESGSKNLVAQLFNGEYFIHRPDPAHPEANATGDGCHIDQVYGQAWAHQVGLGRVIPRAETISALRSLWKYSFAPDIGVYRDWMNVVKGGRWYAVPGEAGLIMCTFPKGGAERATGKGQSAWAAMYFNECMTGFEYQVAAHMVWEGLVMEGLAIARAIHDRYAPSRRNPYNEIECSDHYGRAMAGYGVYLAACGWEYDGPRGYLAFSPRINPHDFRAAFTAAEGWGTIEQKRDADGQENRVYVRHGRVRVREIALDTEEGRVASGVSVEVDGRAVGVSHRTEERRVRIRFNQELTLEEGSGLAVRVVAR